jgi:hypothetical protein
MGPRQSTDAEPFRPTCNAYGVAEIYCQCPQLLRAKRDAMRGILSENSEQPFSNSHVVLSLYPPSVISAGSNEDVGASEWA